MVILRSQNKITDFLWKRFVSVTACLIHNNYQSESMVGECCRHLPYIEQAANHIQGRWWTWWKDLLKWLKIITSSRRTPASTRNRTNAGLRLGHVTDAGPISPALAQCLVFAGMALSQMVTHSGGGHQQRRDINHVLVQCWPIVSDAGPILNQQKGNVTCLLGVLLAPIAVLQYARWGVTNLIVCIHIYA